ncbi:nuclear transport factor 2 family protein [Kitasatospora sp. NBC_01250]|uniref:nuclear transport factor 2 family protein n=1 Tax=unclassified Kitasatospora TaxID=2633591 RepID=UPI002E0DF198|nr:MULTISPECIES: nuclear transport factor 2 family protein [unclassified Kitasatospora]WSJ71523.1 nuclear transport factor 2 family protein [Kitasatospora sp. NBC_01302]
MTNIQDLAAQYLATWNETDAEARRKLIDTYWAADATYTDPLVEAAGRDAIDATIGAVQAQFPGLVFTLGANGVDAHHRIGRFTWDLGPAGAEALVVGFDVLVATEDGLIASVLGFLDQVPAA